MPFDTGEPHGVQQLEPDIRDVLRERPITVSQGFVPTARLHLLCPPESDPRTFERVAAQEHLIDLANHAQPGRIILLNGTSSSGKTRETMTDMTSDLSGRNVGRGPRLIDHAVPCQQTGRRSRVSGADSRSQ